MAASISVRPAVRGDAGAIAVLLTQLGYPVRAEEVIVRLGRMNGLKDVIVLVADIEEEVVGVITGHVFPSIHDSLPVAQLTSLVVNEDHRKLGVGARLTAAVEEWAREIGAARITLTSGLHRDEAHAFYKHLGYQQTGVRLAKEL